MGLFAALTAGALAACSDDVDPGTGGLELGTVKDLGKARRIWAQNGSRDYRLTITQFCYCRDAGEPLTVEVRQGVVVRVEGPNGEPRPAAEGIHVPLLFERASEWLARPEGDGWAEFDRGLGYPVEVGYRGHPEVDDFGTIRASDYRRLSPAPPGPPFCRPTCARTYDFGAYDARGGLAARGVLGLDLLELPMAGVAHFQVQGVRCLEYVGAPGGAFETRSGRGGLTGQVTGTQIGLDLDPGYADNNLLLSGRLAESLEFGFAGTWALATIVGPTEQGTFRADRR